MDTEREEPSHNELELEYQGRRFHLAVGGG